MPNEVDVIAERAQPAIQELQTADILIAIPTFNNENTIGSVLNAARMSLLQFPEQKAVIAQVDGGSNDATLQRGVDALQGHTHFVQLSYPVYPLHKLEVSHLAVPGKDSAYRTIFFLAEELGAKACCVVSGDASGISPDWISSLLRPVLEMNFDLTTPLYQRRKYEGLLVNGVLYPAIRALFGPKIRQPVGSDFGYSRALIQHCLALDAWTGESARRDIDLWLTLQAIQAEMKICEVRLGSRHRSGRGEGVPDIGSILASVAGALYLEMERTAELWQRARGSTSVPAFGLRFDEDIDSSPPGVKPMIETFCIGCENLQEIWSMILPPAALLELKRLSRLPENQFRYSDALWARTIYDFAVAHRLHTIGRDHLLRSLAPLYMGWIASFILSAREMTSNQVEDQIETLCRVYESQKPYLISRWRWPDRFMP